LKGANNRLAPFLLSSLMKKLLSTISVLFILVSCSIESLDKNLSKNIDIIKPLFIPDTTIIDTSLKYDRHTSIWTLNDKNYSGYVQSKFANGKLKLKYGILEGRKQNTSTEWYASGQLKNISNFHQGKLHGENKTWTPDSSHILISHLNYYLGKVHGEQKKWYPSGELYQILNIEMGKEEGLQRAYRKNGALYANYEAKNGRIFGLKKAALCFGLEDQKIKDEE
jgi:hypothetical protein